MMDLHCIFAQIILIQFKVAVEFEIENVCIISTSPTPNIVLIVQMNECNDR